MVGDKIDIMEFGSSTGDFLSFALDGEGCAAGVDRNTWNCGPDFRDYIIEASFTEVFSPMEVDLVVHSVGYVPEPSSIALFGFAVTGLAFLVGRRRGGHQQLAILPGDAQQGR